MEHQHHEKSEKHDLPPSYEQQQQHPYPHQAFPQQAYPQQAYPQQPYPQQAYAQPVYPQQPYPMQQQQLVVAATSQPALTWVYNDLPQTKLKALGMIQIIIGTIYIVITILGSNDNIYGYFWSIAIACSGGVALWTISKKEKKLVIATGVLALLAAIFTAIVVVLTIIALVALTVAYALVSDMATNTGSSSGSNYGSSGSSGSNYGSSGSSGSGYGSSSGSSNYGKSHSDSEAASAIFSMAYVLVLVVAAISLLFQIFELVVSIMLALTAKNIVQRSRPVPPGGGAVAVPLMANVQQA